MSGPRRFPQLRYVRPPGATELLLVRHGESMPAVEGEDFPMVGGHGDPPLSPRGREQAARVCDRLGAEGVDVVVVTTLRRTAQTAAPLAERLGLEPLVEPNLREVFLGQWEGGLFRQKVTDGDPLALQMYREERYDVIPGAEPAGDFAHRVRQAVVRVASAHPDRRVAVFSHGGTIGEVLHQATGSTPFAFTGADNASISHIVVTADGRWVLRRFNDTTHLDPGFTIGPAPLV